MIEEQEKVEKLRKPKVKKGRGRNARKKTKRTSAFPGDGDGDGYEVRSYPDNYFTAVNIYGFFGAGNNSLCHNICIWNNLLSFMC